MHERVNNKILRNMWHSEKYLGPCPISVMEVQKQPSIGVLRKKYSENV